MALTRHVSTLFLALALPFAASASDLPDELQAVIDAAAEDGLPVAPLEEKAREGVAKRVSVTRVVAVLEGLRSDFEAGRSALGGDADRSEVAAAGHALRSGVSVGAVQRVAKLSEETRATALRSLGDMVHGGLPEREAVLIVEAATRADEPEVAFNGLAVASVALLEAEVPLDVLTRMVVDEVESGGTPHGVKVKVLPPQAQAPGNLSAAPPGKGKNQ